MAAVTQRELTAFNLQHHIAPVVPKFMAITGGVWGLSWFISLALKNPHLPLLAVIHFSAGVSMVVLAFLCHRYANEARVGATVLVCILYVFVVASTLCLVAANNQQGLLQSLPYCMVLTAVGGFFWPNRLGLVIGSIVGMTPPLVLVVSGYSQLAFTPRFVTVYAQLWIYAVVVSFCLYVFINRVRRRYLEALRDLEEQSRQDFLTGLLNRRHFYDLLATSPDGIGGRPADLSGRRSLQVGE